MWGWLLISLVSSFHYPNTCRVQLLKSIVISYFHFNLQRKCGTPHSFNWRFWQNPNKKNEWNSTLCIGVCRAVAVRQRACQYRQGVIHKKRVLFVSPLFVGNCQIFNWGLRDRTFYVCVGSLRPCKVRKNCQPTSSTLVFLVWESLFVQSFYIDVRKLVNQSKDKDFLRSHYSFNTGRICIPHAFHWLSRTGFCHAVSIVYASSAVLFPL